MTTKNKQTVAILSDIHSNYPAFCACFEDAKKHGADCFIFLGDYISDLAEPKKTMDLIYEIQKTYPAYFLGGNRERYMLTYHRTREGFSKGSQTGSLLFTYKSLRSKDIDFFRSLKIYDTVEFNGIPFEIAHARKGDDRYYFDSSSDCLDNIFNEMQSAYLLTGHSHRQYIKRKNGKTVLNPGSVGLPHDGANLASYALMHIDGAAVSFSLRQIAYDIAAVIHAQFESRLAEYANYWAIGVLYDVITGNEWILKMLSQVETMGDPSNETFWQRVASDMNIKCTEQEIIAFAQKTKELENPSYGNDF